MPSRAKFLCLAVTAHVVSIDLRPGWPPLFGAPAPRFAHAGRSAGWRARSAPVRCMYMDVHSTNPVVRERTRRAGCPESAAPGCVSFGDFFLHKQRKVTRSPGGERNVAHGCVVADFPSPQPSPTRGEGAKKMGNRLSKIYTRTGDDGTTGLGDGSRVPKDSPRVEAYGTVDELNSCIGVLLAQPALPPQVIGCLTEVQHELFDMGGELCIPGHTAIRAAQVTRLEEELDAFNEGLPALKEFILPGGGAAAAACHLARAVARRAERRVWTLAAAEAVGPEVTSYLNRLSDLLFVIARVLARHEHGTEVLWHHERAK